MMSGTQRRGLITLLCKDPDNSQSLGNWRPISLLNTDYKIISKALSLRLSKVLSSIVSIDQTCSVPGRSITDNIHLFRNIVDFCNSKGVGAAFVSLDQAKAFDRVSHHYMFSVLKAFGFGPSFVKWVSLLYHDISSSVLVNGFISDSFPVSRGVRQGCGLSPLLYVLCMEPFAHAIKADPHIRGLSLPGSTGEARISQYADDTTLILTSKASISKVFLVSELYGLASGAKLNKHKCKGLWLGSWRGSVDTPGNIIWSSESIKLLGVYIGGGPMVMGQWDHVVNKLSKVLNDSKGRFLSFMGRATLVNVYALSKVWYLGSVMELPNNVCTKITRLVFEFLWQGRPESLKREVVYNHWSKGGLGLFNVSNRIMAYQIKHLARLVNGIEANWRFFAIYYVGFSLRTYVPEFGSNLIPHSDLPTMFYAGVMSSFRKLLHKKVEFGFTGVTVKTVYWDLQQSVTSKIVEKVPENNFVHTWKAIHNSLNDPAHRDIAWRCAHHILPTQLLLVKCNITKNIKCAHCKRPESLAHMFYFCPLVKDLWLFVEALLTKMSNCPITVQVDNILYCSKMANVDKELENVALILVNMCKYIIWTCRNEVKYEKKWYIPGILVTKCKSYIRNRVKVDFVRLANFTNLWCSKKVICQVDQGCLVINM
jgi:hypothetical protein